MHWTIKLLAASSVLGTLAACTVERSAVPVVVEQPPTIVQAPAPVVSREYYEHRVVDDIPPDADYYYQRRSVRTY